MATLSHAKSRRMYSWWWDSHISPKNSKWLQDNLTDMDSKVKAMIKLIEEDADSFARRAEMYYKKRPELMKLVEEFYRAYRAMAERYDNATVVIRQAHQTMSKAFPNQDPSVLLDDSPENSGSGDDFRTPEVSTPPRVLYQTEDLQRNGLELSPDDRYDNATVLIGQADRTMSEAFPNQDPSVLVDDSPANSGSGDEIRIPELSTAPRVLYQTDDMQRNGLELSPSHVDDAKRNGEHTEFSDSEARRNGLRPNNDLSQSGDYPKLRIRKGLNFDDEDGKELRVQSDDDHRLQAQSVAGSDQVGRSEEILILKKALAELEAEKEAGILQFQNSLEKLSKLESAISHVQEDSRNFSERASIAEAEVQKLKEALSKLQAEKDNNLLAYHQCLDKISSLEKIISQAKVDTGEVNERASKAESEAQSLRDELEKVTSEKDVALDQYVVSLEKISNLENRLEFAAEDAKKLSERAEKAENQIETLKKEISKFSEEKEAAAIQLKQCLENISSLEQKLLSAQEEVQNLRIEIDHGISKLKDSEKQRLKLERSNQSLHTEVESLTLKMDAQDQELIEKQKELGRLWTCIQEEHLRFVEAETAFQTLQHLHAKTQEEIQSLAMELQNRVQILKEVEANNQILQDEVLKVKEENTSLSELNVSSAISVRNMQEEISMLRDTKGKLESEVELRVDQGNALQQEIYCLKEELNSLNKKHLDILEQVHAAGFSPECLKSSVRELQAVNSNLKETCERERSEKESLLRKLEIMEELLDKNSILENSLSHLSAELEAARGNIKALKESLQTLLQEKSNLLDEKVMLGSQLQVANENLEKLSEHNTVLEKTVSDAHDELQTMKEKLKTLEDFCQLLADEKAGLASEKDILGGQLESTRLIVEELERRFAELEERYLIVEKERASALSKIEQLQVSLHVEKQEHACFSQMNETRLGTMQYNIHLLQEECQAIKREFDTELDRALHSEIEIFILQRCAQDLKETNLSLLVDYQKLLEASRISENVILELQKENVDKTKEVKSLSHQSRTLRDGVLQMLRALEIVLEDACQDDIGEDRLDLTSILHKVEDTKISFGITEVENQKLALEKMVLVTLLRQLSFEAEHLELQKMSIEHELEIRMDRIIVLQNEASRFHEMNAELKLKLRNKDHREEALVNELEDLQRTFLDVKGSLQDLKRENLKILEEKQSLIEEYSLLKENNKNMEGENYIISHEMLSMAFLSLIFENYIGDKTFELKELIELVGKLQGENGAIRGKLSSAEKELEEVAMENNSLRDKLHKSEAELEVIAATREKLSHELLLAKDLLLEEQVKTKTQQEALQAELQKQMNEIKIWESQALEIFSQLQKSTVFQVIYEQKVRVLIEACNSLRDANVDKDSVIKLLEEKLNASASENEGLNAQLAALGPAITSLGECIASLESRTSQRKLQKPTNEELQDDERTKDMPNHSPVKDNNLRAIDASLDLQDLANRVRVIEQTVVEMEQLVLKENSKVHSQLESALRQIEELKSENSRHRRNSKPRSEISEVENALIMKDIVLDQVSESSSKRREQVELWDTADLDHSIGLTVGKAKKMVTPSPEKRPDLRRVKTMKKKRREYPTSDALVEKELGVDKLEISKKSMASVQEGNDRKILQRLNSDIQKLTNLHITVQDLTKKIEIIEKSRKGKAIDEIDTLKEQLEEAEATILKLFNLNAKLMKNIDDSSASDMKSTMESEDSEGIRRRRISEQARRISEKVGRLQLEVQKIQFVLLKLDDDAKESKGKTQMSESRRRVLLRDFLYGGPRISQSKRKKAPFCGCVQPSTRGD